MMLRLVCLSVLAACVAGQATNSLMNMMALAGGGGAASGGASGAGGMGAMGGMASLFGGSGGSMMGGMMGRMMNNPLLLCKQTENFRPIPCQGWRNICNIVSMTTYKFPNLMSCSPMGFGCCIKDYMSLMFVNRLG